MENNNTVSGKTIKQWREDSKAYQTWLKDNIWTAYQISETNNEETNKHYLTFQEALDWVADRCCKSCNVDAKNGGGWYTESGTYEGDLYDWFETPDIMATACGAEFCIELTAEYISKELEYAVPELLQSNDIEFIHKQLKQLLGLTVNKSFVDVE
jgi:hypothetical protein